MNELKSAPPAVQGLMTIPDTAEYLQLCEKQIRILTKNPPEGVQLLPTIRIGKSIRFRREDVDNWIEKHTSSGGEDS